MFSPDYGDVQTFCDGCNVCTVCAACATCAACLIDGFWVPDAELGAVGLLGMVGRAVGVANW